MSDVSSTAAGAVAAGAGAAFIAQLGFDPGQILPALIGAGLGATFAKEAPKFRSAMIFSCVVLASSLFGAYAAIKWGSGLSEEKKVAACLIALFFHPITNAVVDAAPKTVDIVLKFFSGMLDRIGFGGKQ